MNKHFKISNQFNYDERRPIICEKKVLTGLFSHHKILKN